MNDSLQTLISLLEKEKLSLEKLISESLADHEYLSAHNHSRALNRTNGRLQTLKNLADPQYDEKCWTLDRIKRYEERLKENTYEQMQEYYQEKVNKAKEKLDEINLLPLTKISEDPFLLEQTLLRLIKREIKDVKLILNKDKNFLIKFSYNNSYLKLTLPHLKSLMKEYFIFEGQLKSFQKIGFVLNSTESRLTLSLKGEKHQIINKVLLIISKIVFEIFYFPEFKNKSFIQFKEKSLSQ